MYTEQYDPQSQRSGLNRATIRAIAVLITLVLVLGLLVALAIFLVTEIESLVDHVSTLLSEAG